MDSQPWKAMRSQVHDDGEILAAEVPVDDAQPALCELHPPGGAGDAVAHEVPRKLRNRQLDQIDPSPGPALLCEQEVLAGPGAPGVVAGLGVDASDVVGYVRVRRASGIQDHGILSRSLQKRFCC